MTSSGTSATFDPLTKTSLAYIGMSILAAAIAIAQNLPAQPMGEGSGTGRPVLQEFLIGNGTGMSPGLPWLALMAVLTYLARRRDRWGTWSTALLGFAALLSGIFATTEPVFRQTFSGESFDAVRAVVEIAMVVLPILIVVFAVLQVVRRRRTA